MPQEILYEIYGEIRETRAELKAHRENSDERHRSVHKRMDRLEDHFRSEIKDLREDKPPPSSTSSFAMLAAIFKVLEALLTHRAKIVWGASMLAALWGVKNPELLRVELQKILTQPTK